MNSMKKLFILFSTVLFSSILQAATLNVPTQHATIQAAVAAATAGDTINIAAGTYYENVVIEKNVTLVGDGAATTIIDGGGGGSVVSIYGPAVYEDLVSPVLVVGIQRLTLRNGSAASGGGVYVADAELTMQDCVIKDNRATEKGGGIANSGFQRDLFGILNSEVITLINCTINGNTAPVGGGLGSSYVDLDMENCTVSGNSVTTSGGGLSCGAGANAVLKHLTVAFNAATAFSSKGGGIDYSGSMIAMNNSIVATNTAKQAGKHNINGTIPVVADNITDGDPKLAALADNGGPTPTHALLADSPALNTGAASTTTFDQRGFVRPQGAGADIGAYECQAPVIAQGATVTQTMSEDGAPTAWATPTISATDLDSATLAWSKKSGPSHGTATVSGTGASPTVTYVPTANWNGEDSFEVQVTDEVGNSNVVAVVVTVSAINDAPAKTAAPAVTGTYQVGQTLNATSGTWNDTLDTAVSGSSEISYSYQWQHGAAVDGPWDNIGGATAAAYTLTMDDNQKFVRIEVTATDSGVGAPATASAVQASAAAVVARIYNSTQGTYSDTLQAAITAANAADVINVSAGSYAEALTIDKKLTLQASGASYEVAGDITFKAADITVSGCTLAAGHKWVVEHPAKIQDAIVAANANDTVEVKSGTYLESLTLSKALNLTGQAGATVQSAGNAVTVSANGVAVRGFALAGAIGLSAANVSGLTIENNTITAGAVGLQLQGLSTVAGPVVVQNNSVTLLGQLAGSNPTVGIVLAGAAGPQAIVLQNNVVQNSFYGYLLYAVNTSLRTTVSGGSISGVAQGVAVINVGPAPFTVPAPTSFGVDGVTMSGFAGSASQAGVYVYTGGSDPSAGVVGTVTNVTVVGTGKTAADCAGLSFSDFSTGDGVRQQITVTGCTLTDNANRGIIVRGDHASVEIARCVLTGNGADPIHTGGNDGFGVSVFNGAHVNLHDSTITNPASVANGYTVTALHQFALTGGNAPSLTVRNCVLNNNGCPSGLLATAQSGTMDALNNWWGTLVQADVAAKITGSVLYTPWQSSAACDNLVPYDLTLSATSLKENLSVGADVGTLESTDSDGNPPVYALADGGGLSGADNASFTIDGASLKTAAVFNYEAKSSYAICVQVDDGKGGLNWQTFTVTVNDMNDAPVITQGDSVAASIPEDGAWTAPAVSATDQDAGSSLTWSLVDGSGPAHGVATVSGSGAAPTVLTYAPEANYNGSDSFQIQVIDNNGATDVVTVSVMVSPLNDAPNNTAPPSVAGTHHKGEILTAVNGNWDDSTDRVPGALTFSYQWQRATSAAGAGESDIGGATAGAYLLTQDDNGMYVRVRVTCSDNGEGIPATQSVTLDTAWTLVANAAPVITEGETISKSMDEDNNPTAWSLTLNATDTDSIDTLSWTIASAASYGTATVLGDGLSKSVGYVPVANWNGNDNFSVKVSDGLGGEDTITVNVTVAARNDAPVCTVVPAVSGIRQAGQTLTATSGTWDDEKDTAVGGSSTLSYGYQWQRADNAEAETWEDIAGATQTTYVLTADDSHKAVRFQVTATDTGVGVPASTSATAVSIGLAVKPVRNVTRNTFFDTIQAAVTDESTVGGDVIEVADGTYAESVVVSKALTIQKSGAGYTVNGDVTFSAKPITITDCTLGAGQVWRVTEGALIQNAIAAATPGNTIRVAAGTYAENLVVDKALSLLGPNAGKAGYDVSRDPAEAVLVPAVSSPNGEIVMVRASNVTVDGFTIDGDNPALTSTFLGTNGADLDAAEAVTVYVDNVSNLRVVNNVMQNLTYFGVTIFGATYSAPATTGHAIENNLIRDLGTYNADSGVAKWGGGVLLYNSQYAKIAGNVMANVRTGVQTGNFHSPNPGASEFQVISGNTIAARRTGVFHNLHTGTPSPYTLSGNTITAVANANETLWRGILLGSLDVDCTLSGNVIDGTAAGIATEGCNIWNVAGTHAVVIQGGSVTGVDKGVFANNFEGYSSDANEGAHVALSGVTIAASEVGVLVWDSTNSVKHAEVSVSMADGVSISGGGQGVKVVGSSAKVTSLGNTALSGQAGDYILIASNAMAGVELNATAATFAGKSGATMSLAELLAVEDKITHKVDNATLGFVRVKADNVYVTQTSGSIQRGINAATAGDTVYVGPGEFDGKVTISKTVKLLSADGLATTTIKDTAAVGFGTLQLVGPTTGVQVGDVGHGFTIIGIDNLSAGIEYAAVYLQFANTDTKIIGNKLVAAGDGALVTEYGLALSGLVVTDNEFAGQTFVGPNPAGEGFSQQDTLWNVPRQLVVVQGTGGPVTFSRNVVSGTAGGTNSSGQAQGNTLVTIDTANAVIADNIFSGVSTRYATALRIGAIGTVVSPTVVSGNEFSGGTPGGLFVRSAASATAQINANSFVGFAAVAGAAISNGGTAMLNAQNNWFGSLLGPVTGLNPGGVGGGVSANVDFNPWLGYGTDMDLVAMGFQPDLGTVLYAPLGVAFSQQPVGNVGLGVMLSQQPVLQVTNETGNVATQFTGNVTLAFGANLNGGVLNGTLTKTAVAGVATFTDLNVTEGGGSGFTLVATSPALLGSESALFDVLNPLPKLQSISPIFKTVNSGDFTLTLDGENFVPNSKVMWGTTEKTPVTFSASQLTVLISNADIATAGPVSVTVVSPLPNGGSSAAMTFTVTATAQAPVVYVDDNWDGFANCGGHVWGYDAFATIQGAVNGVAVNGTVNVLSGTYTETVTVGKIVNLVGAVDGDGGELPTISGTVSVDVPTSPDAPSRIENINFKVDAGHCLILNNVDGGVTVKSCMFNGDGKLKNAIELNGGSNGSNLTVEDSIFTNGFYLAINGTAKTVDVRRCVVKGGKSGINMQSGETDLTVEDCEITVAVQGATSSSYGIRFSSDTAGSGHNLAVTGSRITVDPNGFVIDPLQHRAIVIRAGAAGTLKVENCAIDGLVANGAASTLNASGNWWGGADSAVVTAKILAGSPVDYTPWLNAGTDTDAGAVGFKGDFAMLWVDDNSPQVGTTGRIQEGVNLVTSGGSVNALAGTYNEAITLNKSVYVIGAGKTDTIISQGVVLSALIDGVRVMSLSDLSVVATTSPYIGDTVYAIRIDATSGNTAPVRLTNVAARSPLSPSYVYGAGVFVTPNGNVIDDVILSGCTIDNSWTHGLFVKNSSGTSGALTDLVVTDTTFDNNRAKGGTSDYGFGFYVLAANANPSLIVDRVSFTNCSFSNNYRKGMYVEVLSNATFDQVTVIGNSREGVDLNLKWDTYANLSFSQCQLTGNSLAGAGQYPDLHIKGRNDGATYGANPASISGISVSHSVLGYASFGNNIVTAPVISESSLGALVNYTSTGVQIDAENNWWGSLKGPAHAANAGGDGAAVSDNVDYSPWLGDGTDTLVDIGFQPNAAPIYYTPKYLVFSAEPADGALGDPLSPQPVVTVMNENDEIALQFSGPVYLALGANPGSGTLSGVINMNCTAGVATFGGLSVTVGGGSDLTLVASTTSPILGATSAAFDIANPMPTAASLSPYWTRAGSGAVTLTVTGTGFTPTSVVLWNAGSGDLALETTYDASANSITAVIPEAYVANIGTANVKVYTPAAGGGTSTPPLVFRIEADVPSVVYVDDSYAELDNDMVVNWPAGSTTVTGRIIGYDAFATIYEGVENVAEAGTVNVAAGLYPESVDITTSGIQVIGPNAGINPITGIRNEEAVIDADWYGFFVEASAVTIDGFTISGLETDAEYGVWVEPQEGFGGLRMANNIIEDVYCGFYGYVPEASSSDNIIFQNKFSRTTDYSIWADANYYVSVVDNVLADTSIGIYTQGASIPEETGSVLWSGNTISATQAGIWYDLASGDATGLTIQSNTIAVADSDASRFSGILLTGIGENVAPIIRGNSITVPEGIITRPDEVIGYDVWNVTTTTGMTVEGGVVSRCDYGVWLDNDGSNEGSTVLKLRKVDIRASVLAGVYVNGQDSNGASVRAELTDGCTITNSAVGILVEGEDASVDVGDTAFTDIAGDYIVLASDAMAGNELNATAATFDGKLGSAMTLDELMAVEDKITHMVDDPSLGFVRVKADNVYVTQASGSIQRGIDAASPSNTVNVGAGTYNETIGIGTAGLRLLGPNYSVNPNTGTRSAEAVIEPTDWYGLYIVAPDVSVSGFMFDGRGVADTGVYARTVDGYGSLSLANNVVKNFKIYGFIGDVPSGAASSANSISCNRFDGIAGRSVVTSWDYYANVTDNVISNTVIGIYSGNAHSAEATGQVVWGGNTISASRAAIWYNLAYGAATPMTIVNNAITAENNPSGTRFSGVWITSIGGSLSPVITNNTVIMPAGMTQQTVGFDLWTDTTTAGITLARNFVENAHYGVWVNNYDGYPTATGSDGGSTTVLLDGMAITGASFAGVYVKDNPLNSNGATVRAELIGGCAINNSAVGVWVDGADASVVLGDTAFTGIANDYVQLTNGCGSDSDATASTFGGKLGSAMSLEELMAIENKITHKVDDITLGFVRVATGAIYVPDASGTIDNAIAAASGGDVIYVEAGVPLVLTAEITKNVTFSGTFAITSANIPSDSSATQVLTSFISRRGTSTVSANLSGMNDAQIAAVNANLAGFASITGNPVTIVRSGTTVGYAPTIQSGINFAIAGDVVMVAAGTYVEDVAVPKALSLLGPNAGISPNGETRVSEAIIVPATSAVATHEIVRVQASGVTVSGFTIDGDNPALTSGKLGLNGADLDAAEAITVYVDNVNNLTATRNIIRNVSYFGVTIFGATYSAPATTGHLIEDNLIQDLGTYDTTSGVAKWGGGVLLYNSQYTKIAGNVMANVRTGVQTGNFHSPNPGADEFQVISGNTIAARRTGVFHNLHTGTPSPYTLSGNTITAVANANETLWRGMLLGSLDVDCTLSGNVIDGSAAGIATEGYNIWNVAGTHTVAIQGGSVTGVTKGVFANNFEGYSSDGTDGAHVTLSGVSISATEVGVLAWDSTNSTTHAEVAVVMGDGVTISGGVQGVKIAGSSAKVSALGNTAMTGQSGDYILIASNAMAGVELNATAATFAGKSGATMSLAELLAVEDKITHKVDNTTLGFVRVKADNVYVTQSSGSIQRGIDAATAGDEVHVGAGTYAEDLDIGKSVSLLGPNGAISPNSGMRVGEAIIRPVDEGAGVADHALTITAGGIALSVKGFTVDMGGAADDDRFLELDSKPNVLLDIEKNLFLGAQSCLNGNWYVRGDTAGFDLTLDDNRFEGGELSNGISLWSANIHNVSVTSNVWEDVKGDPLNFNNVHGVISGNSFIATTVPGDPADWESYGWGLILASTQNDIIVSENVFDGLISPAVEFWDGFAGKALLVGNYFQNIWDPYCGAVHVKDASVDVSQIEITKNAFINNDRDIYNASPVALKAEYNWWDDETGPSAGTNPGGLGGIVDGVVDFSPWLAVGTDMDLAAIGFQPDLSLVYNLPVRLVFSQQPVGSALGSAFATQPKVSVIDEVGNVATQFNGTVTVRIGNNPGEPVDGVLTGNPTVTVVAGVATFTDLAITQGSGSGFTLVAESTAPIMSATSETFGVANNAPILDAVGNKSVDEEVELIFTATGSDIDEPSAALTFTLAGNVPAGAQITTDGVFTWTPMEEQGNAAYTFDVVVTDNGGPAPLSDFETITVTVAEVNVAPVLNAVGNKSVDEEVELTFTATATDQDREPTQTLRYTLEVSGPPGAVPAGASIDPVTGVFTWTPSEEQGGAVYMFDVVVTDNGLNAESLSDRETITVTVNEVNVAPVLAAIPPKSAIFGQTLTFTATATDHDLPEQTLTFSMSGAPEGATLDEATGDFRWTPNAAQAQQNYSFTLTVTDNGANAANLSDSKTVTIGAVSATQSCPGFRSPSTSMVVSNSLAFGGQLANLTWTPVLPDNWAVTDVNTLGNGVADVDGHGAIVYSVMPTASPALFTYTVSVPGDAAVSNSVSAVVAFNGLTADVAPIAIYRYHSADYQRDTSGTFVGQFRKIDSTEVNRVLTYWRANGYRPSTVGLDGFEAISNNVPGSVGRHSADYTGDWKVDTDEASLVQEYWRAGGYHVDPATVDGYNSDRAGTGPSPFMSFSLGLMSFALQTPPMATVSMPETYNPGQSITVPMTFVNNTTEKLLRFIWRLSIPEGWRVTSISGDGSPELDSTGTNVLLLAGVLPTSQITLTVTFSVPLNETRACSVGCVASYKFSGMTQLESLAATDTSHAGGSLPLDANKDGLADAWATAYGITDAEGDADGDRMSNLAEYLCGTIPQDGTSYLRMVNVKPVPGVGVEVSWSSEAGRTYILLRAQGKPEGFTEFKRDLQAGPAGRSSTVDESVSTEPCFYRVKLQQ